MESIEYYRECEVCFYNIYNELLGVCKKPILITSDVFDLENNIRKHKIYSADY